MFIQLTSFLKIVLQFLPYFLRVKSHQHLLIKLSWCSHDPCSLNLLSYLIGFLGYIQLMCYCWSFSPWIIGSIWLNKRLWKLVVDIGMIKILASVSWVRFLLLTWLWVLLPIIILIRHDNVLWLPLVCEKLGFLKCANECWWLLLQSSQIYGFFCCTMIVLVSSFGGAIKLMALLIFKP